MRRIITAVFEVLDLVGRAQLLYALFLGLFGAAAVGTVIEYLSDIPIWLGIIYVLFGSLAFVLFAALILTPILGLLAVPFRYRTISFPESGTNIRQLKPGEEPFSSFRSGYARLEVQSVVGLVPDCTVTVKSVSIADPPVSGSRTPKLTRLTRPPRLLCWHPEGKDGNHTSRRSLPKRVPHEIDVAVIDSSEPDHCNLVCADNAEREILTPGSYKLDIVVASESGEGRSHHLALFLHFEARRNIPLLRLELWERGEQILVSEASYKQEPP